MERYAGHCPCCGGITLAPVPEGMEQGSPFSVNILALAIYLRVTHAISYQRLTRMFLHLFALRISEGALDAMFRRAKPCFDTEVAAILARLRRCRIICSDETTVRIAGRTHWNWVFQNDQVVVHVVRNSRAASVVTEVLAGHRPSIWVSDLYGAQQGHADLWQVCLAHQLRDCQYAIDAGDAIFAPRMKMLLLRTSCWHGGAGIWPRARDGPIATGWIASWTRSWRWHPPTATASGYANVTARCGAACSPSSTIPTRRPTTMAANANSGRLPPRHVAALMPTRQFATHFAAVLCLRRVEQIPIYYLQDRGFFHDRFGGRAICRNPWIV